MGTSLTGLTPATTFDALIKVGDNGPLSATAKFLSDGLGNDSALALSTTDVGIGTSSPTQKLDVSGNIKATSIATSANNTFNNSSGRAFDATSTGALLAATNAVHDIIFGDNNVRYFSLHTPSGAASMSIRNFSTSTNILTCLQAGNVGIGTSAPAVPLDVVGNIRSSTGILFGSDTAAANALDDYEQGTWTMGVSFGGASVGVTTLNSTGTYTKIGRQVTVNGLVTLTSKGSSTGGATITGLPFTIANSGANYSAAALRFDAVTFTNQFQAFGTINGTTINLEESTILGAVTDITNADFANNSSIIVTFTYFV